MSEKTVDKNIVTYNVTGNGNQINTAFDRSSLTASQVNHANYNDIESILFAIRNDIKNFNLNKEQQAELLEMTEEVENAHKEKKKTKVKTILLGIGEILKDFAVGVAATLLGNKQ